MWWVEEEIFWIYMEKYFFYGGRASDRVILASVQLMLCCRAEQQTSRPRHPYMLQCLLYIARPVTIFRCFLQCVGSTMATQITGMPGRWRGTPRHDGWRVWPTPPPIMAGYVPGGCHVSLPRGMCTPPPCMAGFSAFAPPCMVAGPNGLDLKIFWNTG
jgi:hypothetical protein